jgi:hypothetical protein
MSTARVRFLRYAKEPQMNTSAQMRNVSDSTLFRWFGRITGVALFVAWVILVADEFSRQGMPFRGLYLQAAGLAIVFAGYLAGWWNELLGGAIAVVGTAVYIAMCSLTLQGPPRAETILFAAPGICYLLARHFERIENVGANHET